MPYYTLGRVEVRTGQLLVCLYKIADQDEVPMAIEVSETFVRNGNQYLWGTCVAGQRLGRTMTLDAERVLEMGLEIHDIENFKPIAIPPGKTRMVTAGAFRVFGFVEDLTPEAARSASRKGGVEIKHLRVEAVQLVEEVYHEGALPDPEVAD